MHLKFHGKDATKCNFQYDADSGGLSYGIEPTSNSYIDARNFVRWGHQNKVYAEFASVSGKDRLITFQGDNSTVFGQENRVEGRSSAVCGRKNEVFGDSSAVWGNENNVTGDLATVWGRKIEVRGKSGTSWGQENSAIGEDSTVFGIKNSANGVNGVAMGYDSRARGDYAVAIGNYVYANSFSSMAVGYNSYSFSHSISTWDPRDQLFSVSNGYGYEEDNNALSVLKNGNVGINRNVPTELLHMQFDSDEYKGIRIHNLYDRGAAASGSRITMDGKNQKIAFERDGVDNAFEIRHNKAAEKLYFSVDGSIYMTMLSSGAVGIKEKDPSYDLHLGNNSAAKPSSSSWIVASDRRLKQNIRGFDGGLTLTKKINPVWFTYKGRGGMPTETAEGTIAQDLERIAPFMVKEWESEGEK